MRTVELPEVQIAARSLAAKMIDGDYVPPSLQFTTEKGNCAVGMLLDELRLPVPQLNDLANDYTVQGTNFTAWAKQQGYQLSGAVKMFMEQLQQRNDTRRQPLREALTEMLEENRTTEVQS